MAALAFAVAPPAFAVERVTLEIEEIASGEVRLDDVRIGWSVGTEGPSGPFEIAVGTIRMPGDLPLVTGLRLRCPTLPLSGSIIACPDARFSLAVDGRDWEGAANLSVDRITGEGRLTLSDVAYGSGTLAGALEGSAESWRLAARAEGVTAGELLSAIPGVSDWQASGALALNLRMTGDANGAKRIHAELGWTDLAFSAPTGLHAGEGLAGSLELTARPGAVHRFDLHLSAEQGQLYIDPVFLDLSRHQARLETAGSVSPAWTGLNLDHLVFRQPGVLDASGGARISLSPLALVEADLAVATRLPAAYELYGRPFLIGSAAGELDTAGTAQARLTIRSGALRTLRLEPNRIDVADRQARFALNGVGGDLYWSADAADPPPASTLSWSGGRIYGIALGAARADFSTHGDHFRLTAPLRLPVLDGALRIEQLELGGVRGGSPSAALNAVLEPVSLSGLTDALGWPALTGAVAGEIPSLEYRDGIATLGGELRIQAFDGSLRLENLRLVDPFGAVPELTTSIRLRDLSLEALTQAFSFGRITGTLEGDVEDLRLVGWQPAAFDAWLRTPEEDLEPHRISQRAVRNLASLGGGGAAAALSRGFLQFFDTFSYDRLGLGCRLRGTVCEMRGLEPANGGYLIVRGQGLPRIDIVGYSREVSWPILLRQLFEATRGGAPVVK